MRSANLKAALVLALTMASAAQLSGCAGKEPLYAPVEAASAPPSRSFSGINIDQGQSPSQGRAYSSWHAGANRDQQVLCPTPPHFLGVAAWERFEACIAYLNGALSRAEYNAIIRAALSVSSL